MKRLCHPILIFAIWLTVVGVGFASLAIYKSAPGSMSVPLQDWPSDSLLVRDSKRPTLVFFAHPRCACTLASLAELETALGQLDDAMSVHILCYQPSNATETWPSPSFQASAESIRSARINIDLNGAEARRFGATTSGHTFIYSADGRLLFRGGVTGARGHIGVNPGRIAVNSAARGKHAPASTPVFGCPLFAE